jgi:hypothetical protein
MVVILIATLTFAAASATGTGAANDGLWRQVLPVTLVMGIFGAMVLVLSLLSPTLTGAPGTRVPRPAAVAGDYKISSEGK